MDVYSIDVSARGDTVWVTGDDGSCVGRFSKRFGIDVHRTATEQMAGFQHYCVNMDLFSSRQSDWEMFA
jgi:hypothetical protein